MAKPPIQHARTALRQLRALIETMREADAEGVSVTFNSTDVSFFVGQLADLVTTDPTQIGSAATAFTRAEVLFDEADVPA
jgi:hypothetical protein